MRMSMRGAIKAVAAILVLLAAACADLQASSPVQDYLAARDAYLKQFKDSDIIDDLSEDAYRAHRRCFAAQAPRWSYFSALTRHAQSFVDVLPKK